MSGLSRFLRLPASDRALLVHAVTTLVAVRVGLHLFPIRRLRAWATDMRAGDEPVERIAWSLRAASGAAPGTTCLASALALQRLLSRQGHASELHIGVARDAERFAAHAWLSCEGKILVGAEEHGRYTRLTAWNSN